MRRSAVLAAAFAASLAVAACGGGDDSSSGTTATPTETTPPADGGATPTSAATSADPSTTAAETTAPEDTAASDDTTAPDETTESTSSGEVGEDEAAYVDALMEDYDGDDEDVTRCLAEGIIAGIGLEQLQTAGVTTQSLTDSANMTELGLAFDDPEAVTTDLVDCGDGYLILTLTETEATPEAQACADEHVTDELVARVLVASFSGEQPAADDQTAAEAFEACLEE